MKKNLHKLGFFLGLSAISPYLWASEAAGLSEVEIKAAIEHALMDRHPQETASWWKGLGASAPKVMISLYKDSETLLYHRIRLLEALGNFPEDSEAVSLLKQEATQNPNPSFQEAALRALGRSQGVQAHEVLSQQLKNPNPRIRIAAAEVMNGFSDQKSAMAVHQFLTTEKVGWVVKSVESHRTKVQKQKLLKIKTERTH